MADLQKLRDNFGQYFLALNPEFSYVPYQQEEIVPVLEDVERGQERRVVFLVPVGHAKSTLVTMDFVAWWMGKHPTKNVICLSYSDDFAKDFGRRVRNRLRHPFHQELFPGSRLARDLFGASNFATVSGGIYYAFGFDGAVFGKRGDLILIDDPVKSVKDARQHAAERVEFTRGVVKSRLKPGGAIVLCTTRVGVNDYVQKLLESEDIDDSEEGEENEGVPWHVVKIPAERDGKFLWEEYLGRDHYLEAKKDKKSWASLYQQDPESGGDAPWFQDIPLPKYQGEVKPGKFPAYMVVDPALSKESTADRTSIMVLCPTNEKKLLVVDWVLDRLDPDERTRAIIRLVRKWHVKRMVYEEYGLMVDTHYLTQALKDAHLSIRPIPVGRKGTRHMVAKEDRIYQLITEFREEKILFPETMPRRLVTGEKVDLVRFFKEEEYERYAGRKTVAHEEGLDCLSRIHDPEMMLRYPEKEEEPYDSEDRANKSIYSGEWSGTWESLY